MIYNINYHLRCHVDIKVQSIEEFASEIRFTQNFAVTYIPSSSFSNLFKMKGYMYILRCADGTYYTGSTVDLDKRMEEHQLGEGAYFTSKHLPVRLMYFEEFQRIDDAFLREKQIQGWSQKKKEALINKKMDELHQLAKCQNRSASELFKKS